MKFCSILPIKDQVRMFEQDMVMLLAHLSAKYPKYAEAAKECRSYKIMDNSIIELGSAFTMESLIEEAIKCDVNEIILPDVFNDGPATVEVVKESIEWLRAKNLLGRFKLMAVCHGKDDDELYNTFNSLINMPEIDVIGLPKVLSTWCGDRFVYAHFMSWDTNKQFHLLGCWETLKEYRGRVTDSVRSTDTCLPALLSIYGMDTWDDRRGKKIDLEKDEIDPVRYCKIIKELYENCDF